MLAEAVFVALSFQIEPLDNPALFGRQCEQGTKHIDYDNPAYAEFWRMLDLSGMRTAR